MLTCKDATALVSRSMDSPLPWRQRMALRVHLALCRLCNRYERQLRVLRRAVRLLDESGTTRDGPSLSAEARARMERTLKDAANKPPG